MIKNKLLILCSLAILGSIPDTLAQVSVNVYCTEKESLIPGSEWPIVTKSCYYKSYKTISKGYPDFKGRYSWEYTLMKKGSDGRYYELKNALLFNENKVELLNIINSRIKKDYLAYYNDPETGYCFNGQAFKPFNFDQLGLEFTNNGIVFYVTFGLDESCMSVDGTVVSFDFAEIKKYLAQ